jgi:signal transduction histidine kinase
MQVDILMSEFDETELATRFGPALDIQTSAESLLLLLTNISNFLSLSTSQIRRRRARTNIRSSMVSIVQGQYEMCDTALVWVFLDLHPDMPTFVYEDMTMLGYVTQLLLDNAIKASIPGSEVIVRIRHVRPRVPLLNSFVL